jgi:hypothetical protein
MRGSAVRQQIVELLRAVPFHPFVLTMENGQTIGIAHPENIAFDPDAVGPIGSLPDFYAISGRLRVFSTFDAVTTVALLDEAQIY